MNYDDVQSLFDWELSSRYRHYCESAFTCFAGFLAYLAAAALLTQRAISRFDLEVDRPRRSRELPPLPVFEKKPEPDEGLEEVDLT